VEVAGAVEAGVAAAAAAGVSSRVVDAEVDISCVAARVALSCGGAVGLLGTEIPLKQ
jgi:hypothetical protein